MSPVAVEPPGGGCVVDRAFVIATYRAYLLRDPQDPQEIVGWLGAPCDDMAHIVRCSDEARALRVAAGRPEPGECATTSGGGGGGGGGGTWDGGGGGGGGGDGLGGAILSILGQLGSAVAAIAHELGTVKDDVAKRVADAIANVAPALGKIVKDVQDQLGSVVAQLIPNTLALIGAALGGVESITAAFLSSAADVEDLAGAFVKAVSAEKDGIAGWVGEHVGGAIAGGLMSWLELLEHEQPEVVDAFADSLLGQPALPDELRALLQAAKDRTHPFPILAVIAGLMAGLAGVTAANLGPVWEIYAQEAHARNPVELPAAETVADWTARGFIDSATAQTIAGRKGTAPELFQLLTLIAHRHLDVGQILDAFNRQLIDGAEVDERLERLGFDQRAQFVIRALAPNLPQLSDLVALIDRGAFDDAVAERDQLDHGYDLNVATWLRRLGYDTQTGRALWRGHWQLPQLSVAIEMFQREIITEEQLRRILVAQGSAPGYVEQIIRVAYSPLPRIALRQLHRLDLIDRAELVRRLRDVGFTPDDADLFAESLERLKSQEKRDAAAVLTANVSRAVVNGVIAGSLSEDNATSLLTQLGVDGDESGRLLTEARLARAEKHDQRIADLVERFYVSGDWDGTRAEFELRRRGFAGDEVAQLFEEWGYERELAAPKPAHQLTRDLTQAQVIEGYSDRIFTPAETRAMLTDLKYDPSEIDALVKLADYKIAKADLSDEVDAIHARFRAGKLDETAAATELDRLGVRAPHRDSLIEKWDAERRTKTSDLTVAQLTDLMKADVITDDDARSYLPRLGYDDLEVEWLLALMGSKVAADKLRKDAAAKKAATAAAARGGRAP